MLAHTDAMRRSDERSLACSSFTDEVIASLRRRSKAIKYRVAALEWRSSIDTGAHDEVAAKRIDIELALRSRTSVRLTVWGDRWVRIDARKGSKLGWVWASTDEGRFVGAGPKLIQHLELTVDAAYGEANQVAASISGIWQARLTRGPRLYFATEHD